MKFSVTNDQNFFSHTAITECLQLSEIFGVIIVEFGLCH